MSSLQFVGRSDIGRDGFLCSRGDDLNRPTDTNNFFAILLQLASVGIAFVAKAFGFAWARPAGRALWLVNLQSGISDLLLRLV